MATYDLNIIVVAGAGTRPLNVSDFATPATGAAKDSTLTDGSQRVGGTVAVSGTFYPTTQPVSLATAPTTPVTGSIDLRFSGGKTPVSGVLSAAGDNTIATPATGKKIRLVWVSFIPNPDNTAANLVTVKLGSLQPYVGYAMAHWESFDGAVNVPLVLNLSSAQPVAYTAHYQEV